MDFSLKNKVIDQKIILEDEAQLKFSASTKNWLKFITSSKSYQ